MRRQLAGRAALALVVAIIFVLLLELVQSMPLYRVGHASVEANASPLDAPAVLDVQPSLAPNDLDTPIVITGTGFTAVPTVALGSTALVNVGWVSSETLTATVPWGMIPGVYTLTVVNSGGQAGSLSDAFTVTQGIGVWTTGGPYGGRVNSVVVDPGTPTTLYASTMGVGVFRSRDAGNNWQPIFCYNGYEDVVEMDPLEPNRLYSGRPWHGLYRSDDGGESWIPIPFPVQGAGTNRAFVHPIVAGRVYGSLSEGGLFMSDDYGQTWVTRTNGLTDTQVTAMAFQPADAGTMYAGTASGSVFKSTNAGDSWEFIGRPDEYINQLTINPFGSHELWASAASAGGHWGGLWKYVSESWEQISPGTGTENWVTVTVFDREVPGAVWIGTLGGGFKSTDGGLTWDEFGASRNQLTALAVGATDPRVVYQGYQGDGIYRTDDDGATWQDVNHGLSGLVPHSMAIVPDQPSTVYAATTGAGIIHQTTDGGHAWRRLLGVDNSWDEPVAVDPITPTRIYYSFDGGVYISVNGGGDWHSVYMEVPPQYVACCQINTLSLMANPGLPGHLVMGVGFSDNSSSHYNLIAGGIYTSTDFGETWSYASLSQEISPVLALAADPLDPAVIYAGTAAPDLDQGGTGIWKSLDAGATWLPFGFSEMAVTGLAVDHRDSGTLYAVVGDSTFCVSHDAGSNWDCISPSEKGQGQKLLYVPATPPILYTYDWRGMVRSTDGGYHWHRPTGPFAYGNIGSMAAAMTAERVMIYVGTAGGTLERRAGARPAAPDEMLLGGGVYRYTTRLLSQRVYLPVVLRVHSP